MTTAGPSRSDDVLRLFDTKAASWSEKYAPGGRLSGRLSALSREAESRTACGDRILDVGCGSGDLALRLAAGGRSVTGCDISAEMIRRAESTDISRKVQWIRLSPRWRELPFQDGDFDLIVASSLLEYVDNVAAVLHECARVVRPGGVLLCTVPDVRRPIRWLEWMAVRSAWMAALPHVVAHNPRVAAYLTYLRTSHHRHRRRWWDEIASSAGFAPLSEVAPNSKSQPLRLLVFKRLTERGPR